jgi:hypothetical protein
MRITSASRLRQPIVGGSAILRHIRRTRQDHQCHRLRQVDRRSRADGKTIKYRHQHFVAIGTPGCFEQCGSQNNSRRVDPELDHNAISARQCLRTAADSRFYGDLDCPEICLLIAGIARRQPRGCAFRGNERESVHPCILELQRCPDQQSIERFLRGVVALDGRGLSSRGDHVIDEDAESRRIGICEQCIAERLGRNIKRSYFAAVFDLLLSRRHGAGNREKSEAGRNTDEARQHPENPGNSRNDNRAHQNRKNPLAAWAGLFNSAQGNLPRLVIRSHSRIACPQPCWRLAHPEDLRQKYDSHVWRRERVSWIVPNICRRYIETCTAPILRSADEQQRAAAVLSCRGRE